MSKIPRELLIANIVVLAGFVAIVWVERSRSVCESARVRAAVAWQAVALADLGAAVRDASDPTSVPAVDVGHRNAYAIMNAAEVTSAHAAGEDALAAERVSKLHGVRRVDLDALRALMEEVYADSPRRVDLARSATRQALDACD